MGAATLDLGLMADESCFPGPLAQVVSTMLSGASPPISFLCGFSG